MEELVRVNTGRSFVPEYLAKSNERDIVLRMLRNLMGAVQESNPPAELLRYVEAVVALQPDSAFDRWSRAVLLIQNQHPGEIQRTAPELRIREKCPLRLPAGAGRGGIQDGACRLHDVKP